MAQTTRTTGPNPGPLDGLLPTISSGAVSPQWPWQQVIERCPQGMAITRGESHVVECMNDAFAAVTRQARERLVERPLADALFWVDRSAVAMFDRVYDREQSETAVDQAANLWAAHIAAFAVRRGRSPSTRAGGEGSS